MTIHLRLLLLAMVALVTVAACTDPDRPSVQPDAIALPTPLRSFDASVGATLGELQASVTAAGSRLVDSTRAYRPSEPSGLLQTPRVVMRADLAEPDEGFVVVYQARDPGTAIELGEELATYLESGFGQTNYPVDTQFSVAVRGDTVVFTTWSRGRAAEPEKSERVFDAIAGVGEAIEVRK